MKKNKVYILVCGGILIFVAGLIVRYLYDFVWLIPFGTLLTFFGIFEFFRTTDFKTEFYFDERDDFLTYFWNVIALKGWTLIFSVWMLGENYSMFIAGKI
jgi:hypothetical protein